MPVSQIKLPPAYQRIAPRAIVLRQLGVSGAAIGQHLGVSDKTVAKAIHWNSDLPRLGPGAPGRPALPVKDPGGAP